MTECVENAKKEAPNEQLEQWQFSVIDAILEVTDEEKYKHAMELADSYLDQRPQ